MGSVARAWLKAQDPALVRAIRHAFCEHSRQFRRTRCRCLTKRDRDVLSAWVERVVARGYPSIVRVDRHGGRVGARWGRPELMGEDGRYRAVEGCWFPFCRKALQHTGQHNGIREAGARLVELGRLAREILVQEDMGTPLPEPVRLLLRLAVEGL